MTAPIKVFIPPLSHTRRPRESRALDDVSFTPREAGILRADKEEWITGTSMIARNSGCLSYCLDLELSQCVKRSCPLTFFHQDRLSRINGRPTTPRQESPVA